MEANALIAGFAISTVGLSVFIYGKRQQNPASLIAGIALMACPYVVSGAGWMLAAAAGIVAGLRFACQRAG